MYKNDIEYYNKIAYYKFVETLGIFKICSVSPSEKDSIKEGARIVIRDETFEFGDFNVSYDVELLKNANVADFKIGDYTFSNLWSVTTSRSYRGCHVCVSLTFMTPSGKVIEKDVDLNGHHYDGRSILYDIKLLMCLMVVIGCSDDFFSMWDELFCNYCPKKKEYFYKYVDGLKQTIEKYPTIKECLKKALLISCSENDAEVKAEIEKL